MLKGGTMFSTAHAAEPIVYQAVAKACWQVFGARAPDYLEDVVQETWVKLWTYVTHEREITNLPGLAYTVARTTAVDLSQHEQRAGRFAPLPNDISDHGTHTAALSEAIDKRLAYGRLKVLLPKTLHNRRRLAVLAEALKGLRPREIAQHLHLSDQQVERDRQYLAHCIRALEAQYARFLVALTPRQKTIFRYALHGRRSCTIAHMLGISDATVSNELENIRTTFMKIAQAPRDDRNDGAKGRRS
jgi:RNA polymerase sigma factor (sigma-70 family)